MKQNLILNKSLSKLVYALSDKLCQFNKKPIILCLGSDKVIADSLGPIVGELLKTKYNINTPVFGSLNRTISSSNINEYYEHINKTFQNSSLLVIDAEIGKLEEYGNIKIKEGGITPFHNNFYKPIGDISITGVVLGVYYQKLLLHNTKLNFIYEMAKKIAQMVYEAYQITY